MSDLHTAQYAANATLLTLRLRLPPDPTAIVPEVLALTAAERCRSRYRCQTRAGTPVSLHLPRGTVLNPGDLLGTGLTGTELEATLVRVEAAPEPVLTVTAKTALDLLRAAYHLGNRHVPLEVTQTYLRLTPDPVLQDLLLHLGLQVEAAVMPFFPEGGAYGQGHGHSHSHPHGHET